MELIQPEQSTMNKSAALKELTRIPGVGKTIAEDLWQLGITRIADLVGRDPERLYIQHNDQKGAVQDICMLYTFRCAVYYAETPTPEPEKLKWWYWMDRSKKTSAEKDAQIRESLCSTGGNRRRGSPQRPVMR